ncbi:hypothetical protein AHAS_Ahas02G0192600 [Arachis hypogaea]
MAPYRDGKSQCRSSTNVSSTRPRRICSAAGLASTSSPMASESTCSTSSSASILLRLIPKFRNSTMVPLSPPGALMSFVPSFATFPMTARRSPMTPFVFGMEESNADKDPCWRTSGSNDGDWLNNE